MEPLPTSNSVRLHILRAFQATYEQLNILNGSYFPLNPEDFVYEFIEGTLEPKKLPIYMRRFMSLFLATIAKNLKQNIESVNHQNCLAFHFSFVAKLTRENL